ncbi:rhodanese-related sulfurtransferase [Novosphingobium kunmingense]|uniref:Rhodanese-related sulfurtransferase n=1 Tax=Novosphingobium kunmingense TaxID=1211806 RepID=A0A2N0HJM8_9SPHN|nr:rhodanese family protein [Novosphingobium kunmingense]PKB19128.1 rhodanese-related sulfurtransferase [Novosphingobium kunmingense]
MTSQLVALNPADLAERIRTGRAVLVDVREPDEFARRHIAGALSRPLSQWEDAHLSIAAGQDVVFTCKSGARTQGACDRLAARVEGTAYVLSGGVDGWERAGLPVTVDRKAPLEIMRQVQIAAGSLVLIGVLLGFLVAPAWFGLAGFVGAGLTFAGISGFCGMARLLMLAPWNRPRAA